MTKPTTRSQVLEAIENHDDIAGWDFTAVKDLTRVDFGGFDLTQCNFTGCDLTGANLTECDLRETDFTNANLTDVLLCDAEMENGADPIFTGAIGIHDAGEDSRGYRFVGVKSHKSHRIKAGCRWFTLHEAREHWGPEGRDNDEAMRLVTEITNGLQTPPAETWQGRVRSDGLECVIRDPYSWAIKPVEGELVTACPCCDKPLKTLRAARLVADHFFPLTKGFS